MHHKRQTETSRAVFAAAPDRLGNRTIARRTGDPQVLQLVPTAVRTVRRSPDAARAAHVQKVVNHA